MRGLNTSFLFNNKVLLQADPAQRLRSCPEPGQGFCQPTGPGVVPGLGQAVRGQQVKWQFSLLSGVIFAVITENYKLSTFSYSSVLYTDFKNISL